MIASETRHGFECPKCGNNAVVCDSRGLTSSRRHRRRECTICGLRFTTIEITDAEYKTLLGNTAMIELRRELKALIDRRLSGRIVPRPEQIDGATP